MILQVVKCPQCLAPLPAGRLGTSVVCPYCGSTVRFDEEMVPAAGFRAAWQRWNEPAANGFSGWITAGGGHWAVGGLVARGETADVYAARRARWPTERVLLKVLRQPRDADGLTHEAEILDRLSRSQAPGAAVLGSLVPQPVFHGQVSAVGGMAPAGAAAGARVLAVRWAAGFRADGEQVRAAFPHGIPPRSSIWIWRRILEVLSFLHASGIVHGGVLPQHVLIEDGEHGARLAGYRSADLAGRPPRLVSAGRRAFYPAGQSARLEPALDVLMSARTIAALLGGDPATGEVPAATGTPPELADLIRRTAADAFDEARSGGIGGDGRVGGAAAGGATAGGGAGGAAASGATAGGAAWLLREHLGELAQRVFGPPVFCPLQLPEEI